MKILKCIKVLIVSLILLLSSSSGLFGGEKNIDATNLPMYSAITSTNTKTNEYIVVSNFEDISGGTYEENTEYYLVGDTGKYILFSSTDYTIGDTIPSGVYKKLETLSVYNVSTSGDYVLLNNTYTHLGNSSAMDSYVNTYAMLAIVTDCEYSDIDVTMGLSYDTDGVYGTLKTKYYSNLSSGDNITIRGNIEFTNESNVSKCAVHINSGSVLNYANIHSSSKYIFTVDSLGTLELYGGSLSSDSGAVVHMASSVNTATPIKMYGGTITNTASGYGLLNEGGGDINIFGGDIVTTSTAIQNTATGDIVIRSDSAINITSSSGSAIYNSLSANIDISGGSDTVITGKGTATIYLNKGNVSIHGAVVENKSISGNNIYITNTLSSQEVELSNVELKLPTLSTGYHIYNNMVDTHHGYIYLGTGITYSGGVAVFTKAPESIVATSKDGSMKYSGSVVTINYYGHDAGTITGEDQGAVVVTSVDGTNSNLFTLSNTTNFMLKVDNANLVISYMYRVTYSANGAESGVVPTDDRYYDRLDTVIVKNADLEKTGYTFLGWSFESTIYEPGDTLSITKNINFVAEWKAIEYTIEYMVDGLLFDTQNYTLSTVNITTPNVDKEGYTVYWQMSSTDSYLGWNTSTQYGSEIRVDGYRGNVTLTAVYTLKEYVITFVSDSEVVNAYTTTYTVETNTFSLDYTLAKDGYYFFGWLASGDSMPTKSITIEKGSLGNKQYTAYFEEKSYIYYIENDIANYLLYTYTENDTKHSLLNSSTLSDIIDAIDVDRYTTTYADAIVYLGSNAKSINIIDITESIEFTHGKYGLYGKINFSYDSINYYDVSGTYTDVYGGKTSLYPIVINTQVEYRLTSINSDINTVLYIGSGATVDMYATSVVGGEYNNYNIIKNHGMLNVLGSVKVTSGNVYNENILNIHKDLNITNGNKVINNASVSVYNGGSIAVDMVESTSINLVNNGVLNLNGNALIEGVVSTSVVDATHGIYLSTDYASVVNISVNLDNYAISKVVDNAVIHGKVNLVSFTCSDNGDYSYVLDLVGKDLYVKRVYLVTYNYGGVDSQGKASVSEVLDGNSLTLESASNLTNVGYEYVGLYRFKDNKYINSIGTSFDSITDEGLIENSWTSIDSVQENYEFVVKWRLIAPVLNNQTIYLSNSVYDGNNYIYTTVTNLSTLPQVTYTYAWYRSDTYSGQYAKVGETSTDRYNILNISDGGYYYVKVTISDGVDSRSTTSNIKSITLSNAIIEYSVGNYSAEYDGNYHGIEIENITTVNSETYTVTYSLDGVTYESVEYKYKDYMSSAVTIYFKITAKDHETVMDSATIIINKRSVMITAESVTSKYGDSLLSVSATITHGSLVNSDDLGEIYATTNANNAVIGNYNIEPQYTANANYNVIVSHGTYSVTKQDLSVKVNDVSVKYGESYNLYSLVFTGFKLDDNESCLNTTNMQYITTHSNMSHVGTYDVMVSGIESANYNITFEKGTITVTNADIEYVVDSFSGVYDNMYHTIMVHSVETVNGQSYNISYSNDGGNTFTSYSAELYSTVMSNKQMWFRITAPNHNTVTSFGTVNITKRPVTVTIDNVDTTKVTGVENLTCRITAGTLALGESLPILGITLTTNKLDKAGVYEIDGTYTNRNYEVTFVKGTYTIRAMELQSVDGSIVFSTGAGINPNTKVISTDVFDDDIAIIDTASIAGRNTEVVQAYNLSFTDEHGSAINIPQAVHTIKLKIDKEYRDNENFVVVYVMNSVVFIDVKAERVGNYLVFESNLIGDYYIITDKQADYLVVPTVILSILLVGLIVLYVLQCTKFKDSEIRLKSVNPILLSVFIPFGSKVAFIILLIACVFMIFINGIKFMSKISVDIDFGSNETNGADSETIETNTTLNETDSSNTNNKQTNSNVNKKSTSKSKHKQTKRKHKRR